MTRFGNFVHPTTLFRLFYRALKFTVVRNEIKTDLKMFAKFEYKGTTYEIRVI